MEDRLLEGARTVARVLREAGFEAYYAGGCVRDRRLGLKPKDYDIATSARPEEVTATFKRTVQVGAAFGVVRVLLSGRREYEVATFRTESGYSDGRRPDRVEYSLSAQDDVLRRDFTINALLMDPETEDIIDHVGGTADLDARLIRAVGDAEERFAEDRLRMLRAIRFAARFGFEIEEQTFRAIEKHASELNRSAVSAERIVQELHAMWATQDPGRGMALMHSTGLLAAIIPELDAEGQNLAVERGGRLGSVDVQHREAVTWAALLDATPSFEDARAVEEFLRRFKLPRKLIRKVTGLLRRRSVLLDPLAAREAERVRVLVSDDVGESLGFVSVVEGADSASMSAWGEARRHLDENPLPPVRIVGADLQALGLLPGPEFKHILDRAQDLIYERQVQSKEELLDLIRKGELT